VAQSLLKIEIPKAAFEADLSLLEKYQSFSSELLRIHHQTEAGGDPDA
jgi:hypothetical protein